MRKRSLKVSDYMIETRKSWRDAAIVFTSYGEGDVKKLTVELQFPFQVDGIIQELNALKDYWRGQLK
jgi:hypothetical protein